MTDEAKALVERLREEEIIQYCDDGSYISRRFNRDGKEAADLIETQAREIKRLREALVNLQPALVRDLGPGYAGVALIQAALGYSHDQ